MLGKIDDIIEKYSGKEDKLFLALVKKYGPESTFSQNSITSPYTTGNIFSSFPSSSKGKRRGSSAKKVEKIVTSVIIQRMFRNRRKMLTVIIGLDTVPWLKLKDVAKDLSRRFAGSCSVKDHFVTAVSGNS